MDLWMLVLRTVLVYFIVFIVLRLMGKREIGKLSVFDLVISVIIADIAVVIIEDSEKSVVEGILPIAVLVVIQISTAYVMMKSERLRHLFDGKPSILIENGRINWKEMRRQRYTLDDLLLQTRLQNVTDLSKVKFAILETNGNLSVMEKNEQDSSMNAAQNHERLFPLPLIKDGIVQKKHLQKIGKDEAWLRQVVKSRGGKSFDEVLYCSLTTEGNIFLQLKQLQEPAADPRDAD